MMLCCLMMVGTPVRGMDKAKQLVGTLKQVWQTLSASKQRTQPLPDVPAAVSPMSPQCYGVLGNLAGSPYRSPNNGLSRADFRRIKKAREASSGASMPRVQAIAEWLTELKGTVDKAKREASQSSTRAHGVDSTNDGVVAAPRSLKEFIGDNEDGPHVPSSPVRSPVFEHDADADYMSVDEDGDDVRSISGTAEESTGVPVPEKQADTIIAEDVPFAANQGGNVLFDSVTAKDEPAVVGTPEEEQTDAVVAGLLNEMIASLEASESVVAATAEKATPVITEDVHAIVAGVVEGLVSGAVKDAQKKNTEPKPTTQVVPTVPNEVPTVTPQRLKLREETVEVEKENLNGVLLRASGIVTIAASLSCFAYLLVASGLVKSYRELGQVLRSQAVRRSLTSRKKAEAVVAIAAPLLLATGGALVIAGA